MILLRNRVELAQRDALAYEVAKEGVSLIPRAVNTGSGFRWITIITTARLFSALDQSYGKELQDMTSLKKVFLGALLLFLIAVATIRFGYIIMLTMLTGTILLIFYYNERNKRLETLTPTPHEQSIVDESRRRVRKKPWENVD